MRLTSFTEFGLRALMRIASAPDRAFSTAELADEFALSRNHLTKIVASLAQAGIVTTRRGAGGGAMLARPADQVRLGDVIRILEDGQALVDCFAVGGGDCTITGCCLLKARLRNAEAAFLADLDRSTLADIALPPLALVPAGTLVLR
ncbi:RrF2 family transcriptional regulator [Phaeovulum sp.]|uniref:RrF2 family transcriptional regulator n=1 Tax=Phaeovulum sp. TaxID=2934796 RepID=UPI0039E69338